jgi:hypothetical protein
MAFLLNHSPTKENPNVILEEILFGKQLNLCIFKFLVMLVMYMYQKRIFFFLDAKSICCVFVGYDMHNKVYR